MGTISSAICFAPEFAKGTAEVKCMHWDHNGTSSMEDILTDEIEPDVFSSTPVLPPESSVEHTFCSDELESGVLHSALLWMNADDMLISELIVGKWTYDNGAFTITRSGSSLVFFQNNFTAALNKGDDDWLMVDIHQKAGNIRFRMDQSGKYMESQFKRFESQRWGKAATAAKDCGELASIQKGYTPILPLESLGGDANFSNR